MKLPMCEKCGMRYKDKERHDFYSGLDGRNCGRWVGKTMTDETKRERDKMVMKPTSPRRFAKPSRTAARKRRAERLSRAD